jgi:acetyl-CoA carboxylase biotin carboxyl carrier protein
MGRVGSGKAAARGATKKRVETNGWVDLAAITDLIELMDANRLVEVEIETAAAKIRLVRERPQVDNAASPAPAPQHPTLRGAPPPAAARTDQSRPIISPMVGTFYRAPSPDAPPFVEVDSIVEKGDTLCLIEAMKMMNEIEAEFRGRVTTVVATNGQTVEYGEELFFIEPL